MTAGNRKARRGRGSIIKRGSRYSIIVNLQDSSGNRSRKWESGFTTKRQAENRLGELLSQIENGLNIKASNTTFGKFLNEWLERYVSKRVRGSTMDGYRQRAKHIVDGLGDVSIVDRRPQTGPFDRIHRLQVIESERKYDNQTPSPDSRLPF